MNGLSSGPSEHLPRKRKEELEKRFWNGIKPTKRDQIRMILNEQMDKDFPYTRKYLYEMVQAGREGKRYTAPEEPVISSLPREWQNDVWGLLKFEVDKGAVSDDGGFYTRKKLLEIGR